MNFQKNANDLREHSKSKYHLNEIEYIQEEKERQLENAFENAEQHQVRSISNWRLKATSNLFMLVYELARDGDSITTYDP